MDPDGAPAFYLFFLPPALICGLQILFCFCFICRSLTGSVPVSDPGSGSNPGCFHCQLLPDGSLRLPGLLSPGSCR